MDTATVLILVVVATTASHVSAATGFCPPGQYAFRGSLEDTNENGTCRDCAPGFYQPKTGQLACFPCQAGHFANSHGATYCEPCSAGHFAPRQGAAVCSLCPPGHQQPQAGQSACIPDYIVAMQRNIDDLQQKIYDQEQKIYDQLQKINDLEESDVCSTSCVASLQSSTSSLETKASTLERTTSSLQNATSNLETKTKGNQDLIRYAVREAVLSRSSPVGTVVVNGSLVCDDGWDMKDATVACKMFGWSRAIAFKIKNYFNYPAHGGHYSMDDAACTGSESSLYSCTHVSSADENCNDGEEAGVICSYSNE